MSNQGSKRTLYFRRYYAENKDKLAASKRRYYAENKDKLAAWQRRYYAENKDKVAAWQRRYYAENKDKLAAAARRYRLMDWPCIKGCGRATESVSGVCRFCRSTKCRICKKPMLPKWEGQKSHAACLARLENSRRL